jgi:hypothetical protein
MKKVYLQYWEESERGWGIRPDGCSIHITMEDHNRYVSGIYSDRDPKNVPDEYDRTCGGVITALVTETLYNEIENGTLRLSQTSFSNCRKLQEINIISQDELSN